MAHQNQEILRTILWSINGIAGGNSYNFDSIDEHTHRRWFRDKQTISGSKAADVAEEISKLMAADEAFKARVISIITECLGSAPPAWPSGADFVLWIRALADAHKNGSPFPAGVEGLNKHENPNVGPPEEGGKSIAPQQVVAHFVPPAFKITEPPSDFQERNELYKAEEKCESMRTKGLLLASVSDPIPATGYAQFENHNSFILAITGPRRAGKMTLARKLAYVFKEEGVFPGGGLECETRSAGRPIQTRELLKKIGQHFCPGNWVLPEEEHELRKTVFRVLNGEKALLLLHDLCSADQVIALGLPPTCSIIFTSTTACDPVRLAKFGILHVEVESACPEPAVNLALSIAGQKKGFDYQNAFFLGNRLGYNLWAMREAATAIAEDVAFSASDLRHRLRCEPLKLLGPSRDEFEKRYASLGSDELRRAWRFLSVFRFRFEISGAETVLGSPKKAREQIRELTKVGAITFSEDLNCFEIFSTDKLFLSRKFLTGERRVVRDRHMSVIGGLVKEYSDSVENFELGKKAALERKLKGNDAFFALRWASRRNHELFYQMLEHGCDLVRPEQVRFCASRGMRLAGERGDLYMGALLGFKIADSFKLLGEGEKVLKLWESAFELIRMNQPDSKSRQLFLKIRLSYCDCLRRYGFRAKAERIMNEEYPQIATEVREPKAPSGFNTTERD